MIPRPALFLALAGVALYLLSTTKASASTTATPADGMTDGGAAPLNLASFSAFNPSTDTSAPATSSSTSLLADLINLISGTSSGSASSGMSANSPAVTADPNTSLAPAITPAQLLAATHDPVATSKPPTYSQPYQPVWQAEGSASA